MLSLYCFVIGHWTLDIGPSQFLSQKSEELFRFVGKNDIVGFAVLPSLPVK